MKVGDRVGLAAAPSWVGTIEKVRRDGRIDVALDSGGKALGMGQDDLVNEEQPETYDRESDVREDAARERRRSEQDKSWPPKSMETKVPQQSGQK